MTKKTRSILDKLTTKEIGVYLRERERDEYLLEGCVDGWERTTAEIEMSGGDVIIEDGSWVWRDEEKRVRRAFGYFGSGYPAAFTFDEDGRDICSWELRDATEPDAQSLDNLAAVRASVMAWPIARAEREERDRRARS